jgi:hypothetical protein
MLVHWDFLEMDNKADKTRILLRAIARYARKQRRALLWSQCRRLRCLARLIAAECNGRVILPRNYLTLIRDDLKDLWFTITTLPADEWGPKMRTALQVFEHLGESF